MNKNYYIIADNHWGHKNIIHLCNRPFKDLTEMNETMINNWNKVVKQNDIVYHLGDLFWNDYSARTILPKLNGEIRLILGNHDKRWKQSRKKLMRSPSNPDSNLIVLDDQILEIKEPINAVLCHYPLMSWNRAFYGVKHMHGHTHNNNCLSEGNRINVSVELTNYAPVNLEIFSNKDSFESFMKEYNNLQVLAACSLQNSVRSV